MGFYEVFSKELKEEVDAWKAKDADLKHQIETQEELAGKYKALIDADMEKGDATDETAKNSLNLQYAEKRLRKAQDELKEHESTPLYDVESYDSTCNKIVNAYKAEEYNKRMELQEAVKMCMSILDKMEALAKEAGSCEKELRESCTSCGEDIKTVLAKPRRTGLYTWALPSGEKEWRKSLEDVDRSLRR